MSKAKYVKLIMTTENNNNKFYIMSYDGKEDVFNVEYGRVESTSVKDCFHISSWDKKYNEKIKKGYKDVTFTVTTKVEIVETKEKLTIDSGNKNADAFLLAMKNYTDGLVKSTYSVKASSVTQEQVNTAQKHIDELNKLLSSKTRNVTLINTELLNLYTIIPRYMGKVQNYLLPAIDINKVIDNEQDNLDAMASQVKQLSKSKTKSKSKVKEHNLLDTLGISIKESKDNKDIEYLLKQVTTSGKSVKSIFEVEKPEEDKIFKEWLKTQKNKSTRTLIHGTRCSSVIPIIETGLKIRPKGNFQFSGKVYGDGNYFSETVIKSLGYTGYDKDKVLLVYEVHTGEPFKYSGWFRGNSFTLNYKELSSRGFDSTFVEAGNGLLNSEIIVYKEEQCRLKKIIWLN